MRIDELVEQCEHAIDGNVDYIKSCEDESMPMDTFIDKKVIEKSIMLLRIALAALQAHKDGYVMMPKDCTDNMNKELDNNIIDIGTKYPIYVFDKEYWVDIIKARPQTELDKILSEVE